ncbi:hypothetical protein SY83_16650 [Paenibacillus swuensis]|uniref:Uncharacterized protein n=1 Tax=Paenibacillus swuensis TaxID=1178515 RepID=A0A172TLI9_9BACL|nr:hypothetical protein [Paenibacillus swuensis]ANE47643.1 hypothetical protein SY83_16650 [Paenibacillus swuensis]
MNSGSSRNNIALQAAVVEVLHSLALMQDTCASMSSSIQLSVEQLRQITKHLYSQVNVSGYQEKYAYLNQQGHGSKPLILIKAKRARWIRPLQKEEHDNDNRR